MTSSNLSIDQRRRTYVRMIGNIRDALHQALLEEYAKRGLTQTGMADALRASKSFVSRKMNGTSNMTLETLADLAYALDRVVKIELRSRTPEQLSNAVITKESGARFSGNTALTASGNIRNLRVKQLEGA